MAKIVLCVYANLLNPDPDGKFSPPPTVIFAEGSQNRCGKKYLHTYVILIHLYFLITDRVVSLIVLNALAINLVVAGVI